MEKKISPVPPKPSHSQKLGVPVRSMFPQGKDGILCVITKVKTVLYLVRSRG